MQKARIRRSWQCSSNALLAEQFIFWLQNQRYSKRTIERHSRAISEFCSFLSGKPLKLVTPIDIYGFLVAKPSRPCSQYRSYLGALRCFFRFLYLSGAVQTIAPWFVRLRAPTFRLPRVLTEREVERIISKTKSLRDKALIELLYATGCRGCEIVAIKLEDLDLRRRSVIVYGKRKQRVVYFGKAAAKSLRRYVGNRKEGPLFLDNRKPQKGHLDDSSWFWRAHWTEYPQKARREVSLGRLSEMTKTVAIRRFKQLLAGANLERPRKPLGIDGLYKAVRTASERAGIPYVGPHVLRHCFATHLLQHGASLPTVQALMGHCWMTSTQVYTHVSNTFARQQYRRFHPRAS